MLKYKDRIAEVSCFGVKVIKEGTPIDGKHVFRNKLAQDLLDRFRSNSDLDDYGITDDGRLFFLYLNGVLKYYTRKQFIKMAKDYEENNNEWRPIRG